MALKSGLFNPGRAELLAGNAELALINLLAAPEPEGNTGTSNRCPGSYRSNPGVLGAQDRDEAGGAMQSLL